MLDQLYPYNDELKVINPRTAKRGLLELHPVSPGKVYLFDGSLNVEECEAGIESAAFKLAANGSSPAYMFISGDQNQFTIFAPADGQDGFVRIVEC